MSATQLVWTTITLKLATLRSCREISALVLAREDRLLGLPERLAIRLHFLICEACPRFERQVLTMRLAMNNWRHYREDDSDEAEIPTSERH